MLKKGDFQGAKQVFEQAKQLSPDSASVLVGLSDVAQSENDWAEAEELLEKAWLHAPNAGQIAHKMVDVYREMGADEKLRRWTERSQFGSAEPASEDPLLFEVSSMSRNRRFFAQARDWAAERGDQAGAIAAYANATRLSPENTSYGLTYAMMLYFSGQPGLAY